MTLHFRDRRGEASLLHRISSATTVFLCENRSPIRYDFRCGAKGIRYGVNWALNSGIWFTRRNFGTSTKGLLKIEQKNEINMVFFFNSENLGAILKCYITRFFPFQESHYWQGLKIMKVAGAALGTAKVTDWVLALHWLVLFSVSCLYSSYKIIGDALPAFHLTQSFFKL